ncbi:MAG: DUF5565 family protein [Oscillospiraceae bacterium]
MKKIPTLFTRIFEGRRVVGIKDEITQGCEKALLCGEATVKIDGSCCAIIDGKFYKRYDAKKGKKPPEGAIPCCDPDPITGHWPHWVLADPKNPNDKWFYRAYRNSEKTIKADGTFEAIGPHFNGNPYCLTDDCLVEHGKMRVDVSRDFESIKNYLRDNEHEGLVFWLDGEPVCKIKRTDFGYEWPIKREVFQEKQK